MMTYIAEKSIFRRFEQIQSTNPIELKQPKENNKKVNFGERKPYYRILGCIHDPKTVSGSDFDQETAEKIAPQFIARLELANCRCTLSAFVGSAQA